ncbi:SLATT domain-containing protein [Enterococcus hirae]|uniref:SLATT domain-containing protein n=1 Tax=unclassified Enterococcus TaxID=2608891 RepID=UPI0019D8A978|nr:SLATT domain-containing protein [Enterococcus hirae]EMF0215718.1 SLATT domain-containing protein [Enterococcus hirae]EMF0536323.1 SLATT domain-containing protein [Enterococcus hirae]
MEEEKKCLEIQLREAYGRVTYTYTTHLKQADRIISKNKRLKCVQIGLSAVTTGGFLGTIITTNHISTIIAGLCSTISLGLNLYFKNFNLAEEAKNHQIIADKLWLIREKYISLLTDLNRLSINNITNERDKLMNATHEIYINTPKTDSKSYKLALKALKALKSEEEQFFSEEELDKMLPDHLRKKVSNY